MKGYKAFNKGWKCKDFQYEIGKTYELPEGEKLEICKCGFHFCKNPIDVFGYYPMSNDTLIAEIEAIGDIVQQGTKYCTNKIKIVSEFTRDDLQALIRDGNYNSGSDNTGNCNSGHCNTGNCNSGSYNSGSYNSGNCNSGNCNSGNCNSGDYNSGNHNSGGYNSGSYNFGHFNSGNCNSGLFNTDDPYIRMFNKPTNIRFTEFLDKFNHGFYHFLGRIHTKNLWAKDEKRIRELPNFDAEIFKEITGIDLTEGDQNCEEGCHV